MEKKIATLEIENHWRVCMVRALLGPSSLSYFPLAISENVVTCCIEMYSKISCCMLIENYASYAYYNVTRYNVIIQSS